MLNINKNKKKHIRFVRILDSQDHITIPMYCDIDLI